MAKASSLFYAAYLHKIAIHAKNLAHFEHVHLANEILTSRNQHL
ncbi:hypothetical protein J524_0775 [Acinetobacter baumannii 496487]|uniref:Uncharacterized protein n=1 Tax=Acinetobacter baumannii 1499986 TaxID=1310673 RepID=A0A836LYV1_ACIBA|nr:hypothetical protein J712_3977 [Acinetobacter baumannii 722310]EXH58267.1 hypothetical protein J620_1171 [Acinetobacter baumannii 1533268]EXI03223.1 hypothetical protein J618_0009 [Acinetobacter baumannii 607805]EXQ92665.1 hypothetical protein J681_1585 [Acinetobacter baumannii 1170863]EXR13405.1 hypothetical protein J675_1492 [Acinetobacter baumannii 1413735]EXR17728.1 hypothetical protein J669_3776 [Acinetobacter baumannii 1295549]EXR73756.1 hypothetical protein J697_0903 [Acinetobacter 